MITNKQLAGLKNSNVSVNAEKSKLRITEEFKKTTKAQKDAISTLAGVSLSAIYNACKSGSVSAKITIALAQVVGVSPYYITGETDKKAGGEAITKEFFLKCGARRIRKDKSKAVANSEKEKISAAKPKKMTRAVSAAKKRASKTVASVKPDAPVAKVATKPVKPVDTKPAPAPLSHEANTALYSIQLDNSAKMNKAVKELDDESAIILLKALNKRAELGGEASTLSDIVKRCLLS